MEKRGKENRDGGPGRNTSMRPRRRNYRAMYRGEGSGGCDRGGCNSSDSECTGASWRWSVCGERTVSRKLFTKFPDSSGTLGENANTAANSAAYLRSVIIAEAELCRRAWRGLFSRWQESRILGR